MGEPSVRVLQKCMVKPAARSPQDSLFLSALDIMFQKNPHNRRLLFFRLAPHAYPLLVERLKSSLATVLAHFYPFAGRLREGDDGRLEVECNDLGAEFIEAVVEGVSFSELEESGFDTQPFFMDLAPWIFPQDYCVAPPLFIQVSRFECGSIAIGLAHSHVVCDGNSLWHFMTSWAECARGEIISVPPVHTRTLLRIENPSPKKAMLQVEEVEDEDDQKRINGGKSVEKTMKIFHFSKEMVGRLKEKAGRERSSYEAICAHIWKHTTKARGHMQVQEKKVGFMNIVNMRKRMEPPLPSGYFGNTVMWANAVAIAGELEDEDLATTATRIHNAVASCTDSAFHGWLHFLDVYGRDEILSKCFLLNGARLRASSSPRFPIFQIDFGWGPPLVARCPSAEDAGKIIFFPGIHGLGSIDVSLALPLHIIQQMENDSDFINP